MKRLGLASRLELPHLATGRLLVACASALVALAVHPAAGVAACANPVACENEKPGSAPDAWQVSGAGDSSIQGYATAMSVDRGQTIRFKVKTTASAYHIDVYRLGYYQGNGARLQQGAIRPTATLPQSQPACLTDAATGLIDCGNWGVSASWTVPADAVSGVYLAKLIRDDTGGASLVPFVVRDDAGSSDLLVRTSDATWQAYNKFGGNSLYSCTSPCPPGNPGAYKGAFSVSYNRPFDGTITQDGGRSYLFYAEYQLIRFVERNGYDVSYTSQADVDANAAVLRNHKVIVSSGHDEYWSAGERANVEAARDAGVSLAFFSGNEVFWKTRWQSSSADGTATPYRTLTTYKDTHFNAATDPVTWTGTWRDPRFAAPPNAGRPENSLTGQLFIVNSGSSDIVVPATYKSLRLWRNTAVASLSAGQSRTLGAGNQTLGYEWDIDADNGFRPKGEFQLSSTTVSNVESFTDFGTSVKQGTTQTHHLTMYKASSGARVFGAGTVQWAWGLDITNAWSNNGPPAGASPDPVMQQATVNLFADMGAQPTTLMSGLVAASPSSDTTAPGAAISSPSQGAALTDGSRVTISGTATDSGGTVAGVEVSTDAGKSWHPASGTSSWSYAWNVHGAPTATIMARAVDDSGNLQATPASISVNVACPCTMAGPNVTPSIVDQGDTSAVELGVKFKSDVDGQVTGIRFYKSSLNTGTHIGNLWTAGGTLLARGTFSGETASGWQQLTFATPVQITAGTVYVASYYAPVGHYSASPEYYFMPSPTGGNELDSPPLHALSSNAGGANGVYSYSGTTTFPTSTYDGENYAVDVTFAPAMAPGQVTGVTATAGAGSAAVSWAAPTSGGVPTSYTVTPYIGTTAQTAKTITGSPPATTTTVTGLTAGQPYTFTVQASNSSGSGPVSAPSNPVTPTGATVPGAPTNVTATPAPSAAQVSWTPPSSDGGAALTGYTVTPYIGASAQTPVTVGASTTTTTVTGLTNGTAYTFRVRATNAIGTGPDSAASNAVTPQATTTIFGSATPAVVDSQDTGAVELGVKFRSDVAGAVTGVRFYKATTNTGTHTGSLWTTQGTRLGTATFTAETSSGWQTVTFSTPVDITAGTTYIASYFAPNGHYADTSSSFVTAVDAPPLHALATSTSPNGVYAYSSTSTFPTNSFNATNYWVDVVFAPSSSSPPPPAATVPGTPTSVTAAAAVAAARVSWTPPADDGGSPLTAYKVTPYIGAVAQPAVSVAATTTATKVTGLKRGTTYTFTVKAVNAVGESPESARSNSVTVK